MSMFSAFIACFLFVQVWSLEIADLKPTPSGLDCNFWRPPQGQPRPQHGCSQESRNCQEKGLAFICEFSQSPSDVRTFFESVKAKIGSDVAIKLFIEVPKFESDNGSLLEGFAPVADQVVELEVQSERGEDDFNTFALTKLPPFRNLVGLKLDGIGNITVPQGSFDAFPHLRSLTIRAVNIQVFDPKVLTPLSELKSFNYNTFKPRRGEAGSMECSAMFNPLKVYLKDHPELLKNYNKGEVYTVGTIKSSELTNTTPKC